MSWDSVWEYCKYNGRKMTPSKNSHIKVPKRFTKAWEIGELNRNL